MAITTLDQSKRQAADTVQRVRHETPPTSKPRWPPVRQAGAHHGHESEHGLRRVTTDSDSSVTQISLPVPDASHGGLETGGGSSSSSRARPSRFVTGGTRRATPATIHRHLAADPGRSAVGRLCDPSKVRHMVRQERQ